MSAEFSIGPADLLDSPAEVLEHLWRIAEMRWKARLEERERAQQAVADNQLERMHAQLRGGR